MSYLIKDTTKQERIDLIKSWIPDDDGLEETTGEPLAQKGGKEWNFQFYMRYRVRSYWIGFFLESIRSQAPTASSGLYLPLSFCFLERRE